MPSQPFSGLKSTAADKRREREYQAEDDYRSLERAEEVRENRARHGAALSHGRRKMQTIRKVVGGVKQRVSRRARRR